MEHRRKDTVGKGALIIVALLVALAAGCGDGFFSNGGGEFSSSLYTKILKNMDGAGVELMELTACEAVRSKDPEAPCEGISGAQIEVFIDGPSIIFDFSNVTKGGRISESDFEGYIVSASESSNLPPILEAIVDAASSTINARDIDVQFDDATVSVNFQGIDYDDTTFVKIDLVFHDET